MQLAKCLFKMNVFEMEACAIKMSGTHIVIKKLNVRHCNMEYICFNILNALHYGIGEQPECTMLLFYIFTILLPMILRFLHIQNTSSACNNLLLADNMSMLYNLKS